MRSQFEFLDYYGVPKLHHYSGYRIGLYVSCTERECSRVSESVAHTGTTQRMFFE